MLLFFQLERPLLTRLAEHTFETYEYVATSTTPARWQKPPPRGLGMEVQLPDLITHSFPTTQQVESRCLLPKHKTPHFAANSAAFLLYIIPSRTSASSSLPCPRTSPCPSCTCGQSLGPTDHRGLGLSTRSKLTAAPVPIPQPETCVSQEPSLSQIDASISYIQHLSTGTNYTATRSDPTCTAACM